MPQRAQSITFFIFCLLDPLFKRRSCPIHETSANGKSACNGRTRRCLPNILLRAGKAAALVGAEGMDGLARQIIAFKKRVDCHGHGAAVVGIAQVYLVVGIQIFGHIQHLRPGVGPQVRLGFGGAGVIVIGIGPCLFNFIKRTAGDVGQHFCCPFRVAGRNAPVGAAKIILSRPGVKRDQNCHIDAPFTFYLPLL